MTSEDIFNHVSGLETRCKMLQDALEKKEESLERFYAVTMTTEEVAKFHRVCAATVRDYARRGLIPQHPNSTDGKLLFRASQILKLDFDKLRKNKKFLTR